MQLHVYKRAEAHDSLMNDEEIQDAAAIAIQKPQPERQGSTTNHSYSAPYMDETSTLHLQRRKMRGPKYVLTKKDLDAGRVDLTAVLKLPERY